MNDALEAIKAQLGKLKQLADDSAATMGEATAASEAIQRLLIRYNLTMMDVRVAEDAPPEEIVSPYNLGASPDAPTSRWRYELLTTIADDSFCSVLLSAARRWRRNYPFLRKTVQVVGESHNVEATIALFEYVVAQIERLHRRDYNAKRRRDSGHHPRAAWSNSYFDSAVSEIADRIRQLRAEEVAAYAAGAALVVQKEKEHQNALARLFPDATAEEAEYVLDVYDVFGREAGAAAGREVDLVRKDRLPAEKAGAIAALSGAIDGTTPGSRPQPSPADIAEMRAELRATT